MGLKDNITRWWKELWFLIWKDDSFKGWIFSIIFIFIFIKFIFFPILNIATGTSLPLAIVESCSMYHSGNVLSNFDSWFDRHEVKYAEFSINKTEFQEFKMENGFNKGDILLITRANPEKLRPGDIIVFSAGQRNPIIHRIVEIQEKDGSLVFSTMGDNNNGQLPLETSISETQIIGKAQLKVAPYLGWVKLIFFDWQKIDSERGFCREN